MGTPQLAPRHEESGTQVTRALSSSAVQRALRRASNPAYSGSPSGSDDPNGVVRMSPSSGAADEVHVDGVTDPDGSLKPTATLPSKSPLITLSKFSSDGILSVPDHAAFRLKDAEIDTRISSFPLQGGDSLAASPACSLHGSARHSLCADEPSEADGTRIDNANSGHFERISAALEMHPSTGNDVMEMMTDPRDCLSETGTDVVHSALNRSPSSETSGANVLQTTLSSACNSVSCGSVLGTAPSVANVSTVIESLSDLELSPTEAIPIRDSQPQNRTALTCEALPLTAGSPDGVQPTFNRQRVDSSADDHCSLENGGRDDDASSESSVSVGSYIGQSPKAPSAKLSEGRNTSPFTFTTMPGAGHGSPQNHCFKQTPSSFLSHASSTSPSVVRALFTEDSPVLPTATPTRGFRDVHTAASHRALKRLWQAVSLILLTASFAASVYLLGRGNVTDAHRGRLPNLVSSVQQQVGHMLKYDLPSTTTHFAISDRPTPFIDSEVSLALLSRARKDFKDHIAHIWHAAKHRVFRFSVLLGHRMGSLKGYVSGIHDGVPKADSSVAAGEELQDCNGTEGVQQPTNDHVHMTNSDPYAASFGDPPKQTVETSDEQGHLCPFLVDEKFRYVFDLFSEDESVEHCEASDCGSQDFAGTETMSSTASMLQSLAEPVGARALPSFDLGVKIDNNWHVWRWQLKSVSKTIRGSSVTALKLGCTTISYFVAKMSLEYQQMKAALAQIKNYVFVKTETGFLNPGWRRLHGIDHSLIICAAIALLMSIVSMLVLVIGSWQGAQRVNHAVVHDDSDSVYHEFEHVQDDDFLSARMATTQLQMTTTPKHADYTTRDERAASFYTALSHGYSTQLEDRKHAGGLDCCDTASSPVTQC